MKLRHRILPLLVVLMWLPIAEGAAWRQHLAQPDEWFRKEGAAVTRNILSWQSPSGSWPKNIDTAAEPAPSARQRIRGTFDNGATLNELRYLARAFRATAAPECEQAFLAGFDAILEAQYPNGGWPQSFPPGTGYSRHITFNDGTMTGLMAFVREVARAPEYAFVSGARREAAAEAFARGVDCILKSQIRVNGRLTGWCAQHDEIDLRPRPARTYELESISGGEGAGILELLMSIEDPSIAIIESITAGVEWFESAKITGIRVVSTGDDRIVVPDESAPPVWARFYEIETNRPFFCGRDGVKKESLAEIERERRRGYAWYGNWGEGVSRRFAVWKAGLGR